MRDAHLTTVLGMDHEQTPAEPRLSKPAFFGLLLVLLNIPWCLTSFYLSGLGHGWAIAGVLLLPVISLVAAFLGFLGRLQTRREHVIGKGPASVALFVGAALTVIQGAFVGSIVVTYADHARDLAPAVGAMLERGSAGDLDAALGAAPGQADPVQTARLAAFIAAVEAEIGTIERTHFGLSTLSEARTVQRRFIDPDAAGSDQPPLKPVEVFGDTARAIVMVELDPDLLQQNTVRAIDMLALLPSGRAVTLAPAGPAMAFAEAYGIEAEPALPEPQPDHPAASEGGDPGAPSPPDE